MVLIQEFRIVMPMSVDEYRIGQIYMTANTQLMEAQQADGAGVELEGYHEGVDPELGPGIATQKRFHIDKRFPPWLRMIAPKSGSSLEEVAFNAFPRTRTTLALPMFGKFRITVKTVHVPDDSGHSHNVHGLDQAALKKREVVMIDIGKRHQGKEKKMYDADNADPLTFVSSATGRGPLTPGWQGRYSPVMCAYKLVYAEFDYPLLQGKVEEFMCEYQRNLFTTANRQMWCWIDDWHGLTLDEVRSYEAKVAERTNLITAIKEKKVPHQNLEDLPPIKPRRLSALAGQAAVASSPFRPSKATTAGDSSRPPPTDSPALVTKADTEHAFPPSNNVPAAPPPPRRPTPPSSPRELQSWTPKPPPQPIAETRALPPAKVAPSPERAPGRRASTTLLSGDSASSKGGVHKSVAAPLEQAKSRRKSAGAVDGHSASDAGVDGLDGGSRRMPRVIKGASNGGSQHDDVGLSRDSSRMIDRIGELQSQMRELKREADRTLAGMQDQLRGDTMSEAGHGAVTDVGEAGIGRERHHASNRGLGGGGRGGGGDFAMTIRSSDGSGNGDFGSLALSESAGSDDSACAGPVLARSVSDGSTSQRRVKLEREHQRGPLYPGELLCAVTGCGKYAQYLHRQTGLHVCSVQCKLEVMNPGGKLPKGWEMGIDRAGRKFYLDHHARRTQWEAPT